MRSIKSIEKGLQLLEVIAAFSDGARVKDISAMVEPSISNLTLFLNSLVNVGFITKEPGSGKYFLTQKISEIAERANRNQFALLQQIARAEMEVLRDELNENVLLAVLTGHDIHFIERLQSKRSVQVLQSSDIYYPPHVTAGGKAILAYLPEEARQKYLGDALYHKFTDKSLVNPNMLKKELDRVREEGYAVNRGEFESEIMAVASPILCGEKVLGSVVVQFPKFRYEEEHLPGFGARIQRTAAVIAARFLGKQ